MAVINIKDDLHRRVKIEAAKTGKTLASMAEELIEAGLMAKAVKKQAKDKMCAFVAKEGDQ